MYDNSIHEVRTEDYSKRKIESENVKRKEKVTEKSLVGESEFKIDSDTLKLLSYIAIAIMLSILFPLSYWISLRIYNHLFWFFLFNPWYFSLTSDLFDWKWTIKVMNLSFIFGNIHIDMYTNISFIDILFHGSMRWCRRSPWYIS